MRLPHRLTSTIATLAVATLGLTACSSEPTESEPTSSTATAADTDTDTNADAEASWPRTIKHELGETTLEAKPTRIANTAISATGTLLAMDAPLIASAATSPSEITDDKGFFSQWSDLAEERGIDVLYPNLEFDLEALIAADPDVVIVSTAGADSVSDQYEQISEYFPTIAIDYSKQSWQDLARELGGFLGLEDEAEQAISDFDESVAATKEAITAPDNGVAIVSYNGPGAEQGISKSTGAHSQLFESVGITANEAPEDLDISDQKREDFAFVSLENLPRAISGDAVLLISSDDTNVQAFLENPILANLPAVKTKSVYALGLDSFRIDPYSGREILDILTSVYGG